MNITIVKEESEWREVVVKLLLQQKGNTRDDYWNYTLGYAAENGDEAVVRLLLEVGLTLRGKGYRERTPLDRAICNDNEEIALLLKLRIQSCRRRPSE